MTILLNCEDVFAGDEVEGKGLNIRLSSQCLGRQNRWDNGWQLESTPSNDEVKFEEWK